MDEVSEAIQAQINEAIFAGKKILAIKLYRDATGASLGASKQRVETAVDELMDRHPKRFARNLRASADSGEKVDPTEDAVLDAIFQGKKLDAVKAYKNMTGASLLDSKTFVEELTSELKQESPELFNTPNAESNGGGCASVLLLALIAVLIVRLV